MEVGEGSVLVRDDMYNGYIAFLYMTCHLCIFFF